MTTLTDLALRLSCPADRDPILSLLASTGFFRPDEIEVARDVLDDALKGGPNNMYTSVTALVAGVPAGWVCIGPTACTIGTYDVYWIAVARAHHRMGIGRALLLHAENLIAQAGGRLVVIETSSKDLYTPTRAFYLRNGYTQDARLKDFYAQGDDKCIFLKRL